MEIIKCEREDMAKYSKDTTCNVFSVHVKVTDIKGSAEEMIKIISDTSRIKKLGVIAETSYLARAEKTIKRIVNDILEKVDNYVTSKFGEYLISESAKKILNKKLNHEIIPLSELWKEKEAGNGGFDIHTISDNNILVFGESKYNSSTNSHYTAINQILKFINDKKDLSDLIDLNTITQKEEIIKKVIDGEKGFIAAFSLHTNFDGIFSNILNDDKIESLLRYKELYLIGIEIGN